MIHMNEDDPYGELEDDVMAGGDYDDLDEDDDANDDFEEAILEAKPRNVWATGGPQKNAVLRELIKCFGSMVEAHPAEFAVQDQNGRYRAEDMMFEKLLDASKYVARAKRALLQHENFDTREFTIFICNKNWVKNILKPLLELCAKDDSVMAIRVTSLLLILIRRLSEDSMKVLTAAPTINYKAKRLSVLDLQSAESEAADLREEEIERAASAEQTAGPSSSSDPSPAGSTGEAKENPSVAGASGVADPAQTTALNEAEAKKKAALLAAKKAREQEIKERKAMEARLRNVYAQLNALLSFKDALCSEKCNEAICNAFKEYWMREQVTPSEDHKFYVAICFGYVRRILAIDVDTSWSTTTDVQLVHTLQDKYIVQLRLLLSVIPGICSDILRPYHTDWLQDIILIIYYSIRGFDVKELFAVWKSGALIRDFNRIDRNIAHDKDTEEEQHRKKRSTAGGNGCADSNGVVVPAELVRQSQSSVFGKGALSERLIKERVNRSNGTLSVAASKGSIPGLKAPCKQAGSRLRGVYHRPLQNLATAGSIASSSLPRPTQSTGTLSSTRNDSNRVENVSNQSAPINFDGKQDEKDKKHVPQVAKILRNPFVRESEVNQQTVKRGRKTLAFLHNKSKEFGRNQVLMSSNEHQQASVVAATLVNLLTNEVSLKPLVRRVNEDLRRDELRIGPDLELRYFEMLSTLLHYHRLKVSDAHSEYLTMINSDVKNENVKREPWAPSLINVMDALDRMSFTRVLVSIDRFSKNPARFDDIATPMALYKEMVCYLRLQLESGLSGHHELAVARLYTLFYVSQERGDPLPRLLALWRPGTYSRKHLILLVELVHETLKTLDAARNRFQPQTDEEEYLIRKRYKSVRKRNEMDLEQYVLSAMRFRVDDYFRRLVTNQVVRMYTKLLSYYQTNDASVNHHVYCFFQRMCNYTLESDYYYDDYYYDNYKVSTRKKQNSDDAGNKNGEGVHLGFLLFNIHTLEVFNIILNDVHAQHNVHLKPLICLIKMIVRRFGELAAKNHMMFVEALFVHAYPHEFSRSLESVYDASAYVQERHLEDDARKSNQKYEEYYESSSDSDEEEEDRKSSSDKEEADYGDEFNENDVTAAFVGVKSSLKSFKKKSKASRKRGLKRKRMKSSISSSDSDNFDEMNKGNDSDVSHDTKSSASDGPVTDDMKNASRRSQRIISKMKKAALSRKRAPAWSTAEDDELREQYRIYAGTHSVFASIAMSEKLSHRSEAQIRRRVGDLKLYEHLYDSVNDSEDDGSGAVKDTSLTTSTKPSNEQHLNEASFSPAEEFGSSASHPPTKEKSLIFDDENSDDIFEQRSMALVRKAQSASYQIALNDDDGNDIKAKSSTRKMRRNKRSRRSETGEDSDEEEDLFASDTVPSKEDDAAGGAGGKSATVRSVVVDDE